MGGFYLGIFMLFVAAVAIVGAVVASVGMLQALVVFALAGLLFGLIVGGLNLVTRY